jgi:diguanylate cyclase (GGDEF)-like protein
MINASFFLTTFCYAGLVFFVTQKAVYHLVREAQDETGVILEEYHRVSQQKLDLFSEKKKLEERSAEIFMLYDMTREITRNFYEQDALQVFQNKLRLNIAYEECLLLGPLAENIKELQNDPRYFIFTLRGRRQVLGYLVIKGVVPEDAEKVTILAQQFSLGLRRIRLYQEIEKLAVTDSLTEVGTRRYILEHFEKELRRSQMRGNTLSFLMIDVDSFKSINDHYGHLAGDMMLRGIAGILRSQVREIDMVGRYGGEEFCVVLPDTDRNGALYVAERIRNAVAEHPLRAYDVTVNVTISIGSVTFPRDGKTMSVLIDKADWALYRAKRSGRNMVCTFEEKED